jgi:hypothetical protein
LNDLERSYEHSSFKDEFNNKASNYERFNKRIANFVYSCVDFAFVEIGPLHHTFMNEVYNR